MAKAKGWKFERGRGRPAKVLPAASGAGYLVSAPAPAPPDHDTAKAAARILSGVAHLVKSFSVQVGGSAKLPILGIKVLTVGPGSWRAEAVMGVLRSALRLHFGTAVDVGAAGVARRRGWVPVLRGGKREAIESLLREAGW